LAMPLLASEGLIIALKGQVDNVELAVLRKNMLSKKMNSAGSIYRSFTISLEKYSLPFLKSERSIITLKKKPNV